MSAEAIDGEFDLLKRALFEAEDALESLRRCHGAAVSALCYPAVNTVREACEMLRREETEE